MAIGYEAFNTVNQTLVWFSPTDQSAIWGDPQPNLAFIVGANLPLLVSVLILWFLIKRKAAFVKPTMKGG